MSEGESIIYEILINFVGIMGFFGLFLLIISPLYIVKTFRKNGDMSKPIIAFIVGLMFFLTWIFEGAE